MSLEKRLADNAALVEARLHTFFDERDEDFASVPDAAAYSLFAPRAKRIRPTLVLEICRLFSGDEDIALQFAAAVEMLHTYSLIHDDLPCMDDDDLRRGKPTCHVVFGEATALLAGDMLLTLAFEALTSNPAVPPERASEAVLLLSRAAGAFGMIGGQVMDLAGESTQHTEEKLLKLHAKKTGALIGVCAELGCLAAGLAATDPRRQAAKRYAARLGLAFQIVDDVLDVTANAETAGKTVGTDRENNKTTFMTYYTPKDALEFAARITAEAKEAVATLGNAEVLLELADYLIDRRC